MKKQYVISEIAHMFCPKMAFSIVVTINSSYSKEKVSDTLSCLQKAHPFLSSVIAKDDKGYYYKQENFDIIFHEKDDENKLTEDINDLMSEPWNVMNEGLLKVLVYKKDTDFKIAFTSHHLLCDGRGLLWLINEFADFYCDGKEPSYVEENLIKSFEDLPQNSELPFMSRSIVNYANRNFSKEKSTLTYEEYLTFEKEYLKKDKKSISIKSVEHEELNNIIKLCKDNDLSVNDYLVAKMMIEENTQKVVIPEDIRNKVSCFNKGSLGNFATAYSVVSTIKTNDIILKADEVKMIIKKVNEDNKKLFLVLSCYLKMRPMLIAAAPISCLGCFKSKAGYFVGANMFGYKNCSSFSLSNLGKFENKNIKDALFIPVMSPVNKVSLGVITTGGKMNICAVNQRS